MLDLQNLKLAAERNRKAVELRPSLAIGTNVAKARVGEDLSFEIDVDGWKVSARVPEHYGGKGETTGASAHSLSSLIFCLTVGYLIKFAEKDLPVSGLELEVEADYDPSVTFEYTDVRYVVNVESDAPEADILQAIEENDANSFGLAMFKQPVNTHRQVRIAPGTS